MGGPAGGTVTVLMATDVPFWHGKTGAQQRMLSLARFLAQKPFRLVTFYLGELLPEDPETLAASGLEVVFFESQRPPAAFVARMQWYADATRRQLQRLVSRAAAAETEDTRAPQPMRVADYRWPWAIEQFRETVRRIQPAAILCQYVTMSYLLEALGSAERRRIRCILDTHDILHDRGIQFGTAGYMHWLEIDRAEETALWEKFDAVLAIQEEEARLIAGLARGPRVLVTPHAVDYLNPAASAMPASVPAADPAGGTIRDGDEVVIGYIGSANYSNWHAINRFLIEAWPELLELRQPQVRLLIAGRICEWFRIRDERPAGNLMMQRVELVGEVPELGDFYRRLDIAVNPVQFGTGLKIKNVEAMAFGVPLVTTPQGVAGMSAGSRAACRVARDLMDMPRQLLPLIQSPDGRRQLGEQAAAVAKSAFSDQQAFGELRAFLLSPA